MPKNIKLQKPNPDRRQSVEAIQAELRENLPWLFEPAFAIGENQGFDGRQFGSQAGTWEDKTCQNVIHEVSHAIELTLLSTRKWKRRMQLPNFDMTIKTYQEISGRRYYEPITMQATERECRVGGIQRRILEAAGYDTRGFTAKYVLVLKYMADWYMGGHCPMNTHYAKDYSKEERSWVRRRAYLVNKAYDEFSLDDIKDRWKEVTAWLSRCETQNKAELVTA